MEPGEDPLSELDELDFASWYEGHGPGRPGGRRLHQRARHGT